MSLPLTVAVGRSCASATATQPQPVQTSAIANGTDRSGNSSWIDSTISSVAGRGISTSGVTSSSRPQNSRTPTM